MGTCVYCHQDKGKRTCPALGGLISAKCCGQQRGIAIDCPVSCHYFRDGESELRARLAPEFHKAWIEGVGPLYRAQRVPLLDWIIFLEVSIYSYFQERSRATDEDLLEALEFLKTKLSPITIIEAPGSTLGQHLAEASREVFESTQKLDPEEGQEGVEILLKIIEGQVNAESPRHALHGLLGHVEHFIGVPDAQTASDSPPDDQIETPKIITPGD